MKDIIIEIYKKSIQSNFESFFKNIEMRRNVIYTFSKITETLFEKDKIIENKFGKFDAQSVISGEIDSINSENELIFLLKSFTNENKKVLILQFNEKHLNKINSINYAINNFQKEIQKLDDKLIILLIHKQRTIKTEKAK